MTIATNTKVKLKPLKSTLLKSASLKSISSKSSTHSRKRSKGASQFCN